jgi:hypothetical protein
MPKPATPAQVSYLRHLLKQVGGQEPAWDTLTDVEASTLIDGLKAHRGKPVWYGSGQFSHWERKARGLLKPGVHEVEVQTEGLGATLNLDVPNPDEAGYDAKRDQPTAFLEIDPDFFPEDDIEDHEDALLRAVSRAVGRPVTWGEGAWGWSHPHKTRIRALVLKTSRVAANEDDDLLTARVAARFVGKLARAIAIDKQAIQTLVHQHLVPQIERWLKRQPKQEEPIGTAHNIASGTISIEEADSRNSHTCEVIVGATPSKAKGAAVLSGASGKGVIHLYMNGALSPQDILVPTPQSDRLSPMPGCTYETCLPYGLYSILTHEITHNADIFMGKLKYSPAEVIEKGEAAWGSYINDPSEVRAFMQQVVDETERMARKIREHTESNQQLVSRLLMLSTTWSLIKKHLSSRNQARILKAVYDMLDRLYLLIEETPMQAKRVVQRYLAAAPKTSMGLVNRVVARYVEAAAPPVLDEKMKALLLKLRKGADASLSLGQLFKVLDLLGGWKVETIVGLAQIHYDTHKHALDIENDESAARAAYDVIKAHEVSALPTNPKLGQAYVMELEPFNSYQHAYDKSRMYHGAHYKVWMGVPGYRVEDPHGKVFEVLPTRHDIHSGMSIHDTQQGLPVVDAKRLKKSLRTYDLLPWLKKDTSYLDQINALLGMEAHEPAAPRTRDNSGSCGVCFQNVKLKQDRVVLHGYKRPGVGYVIGDCFGMNYPPFELSDEATKDYVAKVLIPSLKNAKVYLHRLEAGEVTVLGEPKREIKVGDPRWERALEDAIRNAKRAIEAAEDYLKAYEALIQHWKVRPLPKEGDRHIDWFTKGQQG